MFVGLRLLEGSELAVEQRRRHEVAVAGGKPPRDEVAVAFQKDDADVRAFAGENVAIGALERRAGDDAVVAGASRRVDPCAIPWSQGQRSSSVSGSPPCIFSMLDGGWNQSPSS
jgi:hypothetical protein